MLSYVDLDMNNEYSDQFVRFGDMVNQEIKAFAQKLVDLLPATPRARSRTFFKQHKKI